MAAPMLANLGGAIQKVGSAAANATSTISGLGSALVHQLMAPLEVIKGIAGAITPLVQLANPAALWAFNRALDNFQAVVGQMVTPVLQGLTIYMTTFGDVLANLMPVLQPLFDQLGQSMANAAAGMAQIITAAAPFIQLVVDGLVTALQKGGEALAFFQGVLSEIIKTLAGLFGLNSRMSTDRQAKGSAVYNPTVSGVEEFSKRQFAESLKGIGQNRGMGRKPEEFIPEIAQAIEKGQRIVKEIRDFVEAIAKWFVRQKEGLEKANQTGSDVFDKTLPVLAAIRKTLIS